MRRDESDARKDRVRLQHMLDAGRQVASFVDGRTRDDLDGNPMLARALMHALLEIGEAAARTSDPTRARVPGLPWGQIVAMRHVLVHVYWGVDFDRRWRTATEEVPRLVEMIEAVTADWPLESQES